MSLNDYQCGGCGIEVRDLLRMPGEPIVRPVCNNCQREMDWVPGRIGIDAFEPFRAFEIDMEGKKVLVDSVHAMRRIERESEQRERNGEGQVVAWRDWSQDRSNRDVNIFGDHKPPEFQPRNSRGVPYVTRVGKLRDREEEHG